ncbi:uncharacterized protein CC84DRAFT_786616 [Paraphaeosphaeria sporulosa]|uniref:Uncharacterized protein n=1 Tax=Paraphaeosphaeria sporulosa TaxID=1460663 RepID=A0A177CHV4_9PLEO|nr:uncharacterized protein CC84DRAFT_786616 [Paraphaeosphaeria sporulosa]OAG06552.1 hypothetical protein CC84DRAFT_786616 [Paraphaeosphaeria sporulosa]
MFRNGRWWMLSFLSPRSWDANSRETHAAQCTDSGRHRLSTSWTAPCCAFVACSARAVERYEPRRDDSTTISCCPTLHHRSNCRQRVHDNDRWVVKTPFCFVKSWWYPTRVKLCNQTSERFAPSLHFPHSSGVEIQRGLRTSRLSIQGLHVCLRTHAAIPVPVNLGSRFHLDRHGWGAGESCRFLHVVRTTTSRTVLVSTPSQETKSLILYCFETFQTRQTRSDGYQCVQRGTGCAFLGSGLGWTCVVDGK